MSSFVSSGVRSVAGKITRSELVTRTSRSPASRKVSPARATAAQDVTPSPLLASDLAGGDVQPVPDVDRRDGEHERGELLLVVVAGGLVPHLVGHGVGRV